MRFILLFLPLFLSAQMLKVTPVTLDEQYDITLICLDDGKVERIDFAEDERGLAGVLRV